MQNTTSRSRSHWFTTLCAAGAALITLVLPACTSRDGFKRADADKSGGVSRPEFDRYLIQALFAESDANRDGKVTFSEWQAVNPNTDKKKFSAPDKDGDGAVTPAEAKTFMDSKGTLAELFSRIDTDKSGSISKEEAVGFRNRLARKSETTTLQKLFGPANQ